MATMSFGPGLRLPSPSINPMRRPTVTSRGFTSGPSMPSGPTAPAGGQSGLDKWLDRIERGIDIVDRVTGGSGGSEPPTGDNPIPGSLTGNGAGDCGPGRIRFGGKCVDPGAMLPGGDPFVSDAPWTPTMGKYGVAVVPAMETVQRSVCPEGYHVGKDGLCYDCLPKSKRKWNPGKRPLLTSGEMNAISKAASAAKRLERTQKRLKGVSKVLKKVT